MDKATKPDPGPRTMKGRLKDWAINGVIGLVIGGGLYLFVRGF